MYIIFTLHFEVLKKKLRYLKYCPVIYHDFVLKKYFDDLEE